ncbi:hypothetical protein ACFL9T_11040 [Thermodesulfobacteriota bacterium]
MKITSSEVIKNSEQELMDAIIAEIDWGSMEEIVRKQYNLNIDEDLEYRRGDIVIHDNRIAYQLEFGVKVTLALLLDREGNHLSAEITLNNETRQEELENDEGSQSSPDVAETGDQFAETLSELYPIKDAVREEPSGARTTADSPEDRLTQTASEVGEIGHGIMP